MSEETSTSSSAAARPSLEDIFRPETTVNAAGDSSASVSAQTLHFSCGNPTIEEIRGVMHLYRDDVASPPSQLPVERRPLLCVLGVPNHMTYADFCQFCGSFIQHMLEMRIVRNEGMEDCYSILIKFDDQDSADNFYKHFNGKRFSSLDEEICRVLYTIDIQYTGSIEHSQLSATSSMEQPSCPVCLERLDQDTSGILTTICNHSFHCSCISKWTDSSCPVCRYCQEQPEKSICFLCQTTENLWMCIICGFVGCGRYKEGHAITHWKETQHCYSIELETQRVWDYVGDNYVHRLIQSNINGKLVELNNHSMHTDEVCGDCAGDNDAMLHSEVEAIVNEYNELLTSQLENQKQYFESLLQEVEEETERESSAAVEKSLSQNPRLLKLQAKLDKCMEEKKFLDDINDNLLRNQDVWESKIGEIEEREKKRLNLKDKKVQELEEQLRYFMAFIEDVNPEQQSTASTEFKDGPTVAESSSRNEQQSTASTEFKDGPTVTESSSRNRSIKVTITHKTRKSTVVCGKRSFFEDIDSSAPSPASASSPVYKKLRCSLSTSPGRFSYSRPLTPADQLKALFPDMDTQLLEKALENCGNDLDSAIKCLHELCLGYKKGNSSTTETNVDMEKGAIPTGGEAVPLEEHHIQNNLPVDGTEWVDLFVREMMSATSIDDARSRARRVLESLEKSIGAQAEAAQSFHNENVMLKEQIEALLQDSAILKRAVAIQHERQKEYDERSQEVQAIEAVGGSVSGPVENS
ncbi:zinc finger (C3HC4-type RING finger) family protein [Abeliophyllum distichum]|uniref:Zinc finger (C3HC4-type RING finger) family protein n=1 Tax=Abeliophyllum distichum TaxID=126358 RepID=A0ABD1RYY9_9LAMI